MTRSEHKKKHLELFKALDELLADYLKHHPEALIRTTTVDEVFRWAFNESIATSERGDALHTMQACGECGAPSYVGQTQGKQMSTGAV